MIRTSAFSLRIALFATSASLALCSPGVAVAQQTTTTADATEAAPADQIVVIGTRRADRSSVNSASPVDIISSKELTTQASSNLLDVVKNIVPSFYVPSNTISDASSFVHSPSLRGLPADETLVMLNGKRFNRSALVQVYSGGDTGLGYGSQGADISSIPAIAVNNLQVLRDGATAQYGSDAIAGVMNYGLRSNNKGIELQGRYGQFYRNGDGKSYQIAGNIGLAPADNAFINVSGEYFDDGRTSRGVTRPTALAYATQGSCRSTRCRLRSGATRPPAAGRSWSIRGWSCPIMPGSTWSPMPPTAAPSRASTTAPRPPRSLIPPARRCAAPSPRVRSCSARAPS